MRLSTLAIMSGTFALAGAASLVSAHFSVQMIETASKAGVLEALEEEGLTWAEVDTDGLQVFVIGTAPDEATRFRAKTAAGSVVDAARVIDQILIAEPEGAAAPEFSIEILRNDAGISVMGLLPAATDRADLVARLETLVPDGTVTDLLGAADFPPPDGWDAALRFAIGALDDLPRSQISVGAERVAVKATTDTEESRRRLEAALARRAPEGLTLALELAAPRPVITPFALRFGIDADGARFDTCAADTEAARDRILQAAGGVGMEGKATCTLGLGVPAESWGEAAALAIESLGELGRGSVTLTNTDIAFLAEEGTDAARFNRITGALNAALPEAFTLNPVLPVVENDSDAGPPDFVATLSPEGDVQIRGRIGSEVARQTADSFAKARFGSGAVYTAARVDRDLPRDWSVRALAALEVLSMLSNGAVVVTPDEISVSGNTGQKTAKAEMTALLVEKLGEEDVLDISVTYREQLDASLGLPTPEECEARIGEIIGDRKITFEPGSATLDGSAKDILDELADLLKQCGNIPLQIAGHTDSQGRESMNQELSQDRAQAVLDALRGRLVPVRAYSVEGFGESRPIAPNDTAEGREANRRIEFTLLRPEPIPEETTTLEEIESQTLQAQEAAPGDE